MYIKVAYKLKGKIIRSWQLMNQENIVTDPNISYTCYTSASFLYFFLAIGSMYAFSEIALFTQQKTWPQQTPRSYIFLQVKKKKKKKKRDQIQCKKPK